MVPFLKLAGSLVAAYVIVVGLIAAFQDKLLFPRWTVGPGAPLPPKAERLAVAVESGSELVGVYLPADGKSGEGASLVLGFGGNAWSAYDLAIHLNAIFPDRDVVAFHYRGYPGRMMWPATRSPPPSLTVRQITW